MYEYFKQHYPTNLNLVVELCQINIQLLPDPKRAIFEWDYTIRIVGNESESEWTFNLPETNNAVNGFQVRDDSGGLRFTDTKNNTGSITYEISFRNPLEPKQSYRFCYRYETNIESFIMDGFLTETVMFNGWHIHNVPCSQLRVQVIAPEESQIIQSRPSADAESNSIVVRGVQLAPQDDVSYYLVYRKRSIGMPFWRFLGGATASGLIGTLVGYLFGLI